MPCKEEHVGQVTGCLLIGYDVGMYCQCILQNRFNWHTTTL